MDLGEVILIVLGVLVSALLLGTVIYFLLRFLSWMVAGLFYLGRRTAKHNPWRRSAPRPEDTETDRIRVPLGEQETDLITGAEFEGLMRRTTRQ
jgi:hypothetical protein